MNIELIKYKPTTDEAIIRSLISAVDDTSAEVSASLTQYGLSESVAIPAENITVVEIDDSNLFISFDISEIDTVDKNALLLLTVNVGEETAEYPVYNYHQITVSKIDVVNKIASNGIDSDLTRILTMMLFLEQGIKDAALYSTILQCNTFYDALSELIRSFKTKYYYNESSI